MDEFQKEKEFCEKWLPMLERVEQDKVLKERCRSYNAYIPSDEGDALTSELQFHMFLEEAYESGIVRSDYRTFGNEEQKTIFNPTNDFINELSTINIIRCIAWHFRADHFDNGSLIHESIAGGALYKYFKTLLNR